MVQLLEYSRTVLLFRRRRRRDCCPAPRVHCVAGEVMRVAVLNQTQLVQLGHRPYFLQPHNTPHYICSTATGSLLVRRQEGHPACKKSWVLVCWWRRYDWSFARLIVPVVTTTFITLSSKKSRMKTFLYRLTQVHSV